VALVSGIRSNFSALAVGITENKVILCDAGCQRIVSRYFGYIRITHMTGNGMIDSQVISFRRTRTPLIRGGILVAGKP
jgi:hypothetical protein